VKASDYLRRHRRELENAVCPVTNEKKYRVNQLLTRLMTAATSCTLQIKAYDPKQNFAGVRLHHHAW